MATFELDGSFFNTGEAEAPNQTEKSKAVRSKFRFRSGTEENDGGDKGVNNKPSSIDEKKAQKKKAPPRYGKRVLKKEVSSTDRSNGGQQRNGPPAYKPSKGQSNAKTSDRSAPPKYVSSSSSSAPQKKVKPVPKRGAVRINPGRLRETPLSFGALHTNRFVLASMQTKFLNNLLSFRFQYYVSPIQKIVNPIPLPKCNHHDHK